MASGSSNGCRAGSVTVRRGAGLQSHRVFLLAGNLTRRLEVDTKKGLVTLVVLANILDRIDMERDGKAMDRQNDGRRFSINKDLGNVNEGSPDPRGKRY